MLKSNNNSSCKQWGAALIIYCELKQHMVIILFIFEAKTKHAFPITSAEMFVYLHCYCIACNTLDRVIHQATVSLGNINVSIPRDGNHSFSCCSIKSAIKMRSISSGGRFARTDLRSCLLHCAGGCYFCNPKWLPAGYVIIIFQYSYYTRGQEINRQKKQPIVCTYPYLYSATMNFSHVCLAWGLSSKTPFNKTTALDHSEFEDP